MNEKKEKASLHFWRKLHLYLAEQPKETEGREESRQQLIAVAERYIKRYENLKYPSEADAMLDIFKGVCQEYNIDHNQVLKNLKSRKREFVTIRHVTYFKWADRGLMKSYTQAGNLLGQDHATVHYALKTVRNLRQTNKEYRAKTDEILMI